MYSFAIEFYTVDTFSKTSFVSVHFGIISTDEFSQFSMF